MKIDPHYRRQKFRPMTLASGNTSLSCMRIFAGVSLGGGIKWELVDNDGNFWRFEWLFLQKRQSLGQQYYLTIRYPLLACEWLQNEWPRMTLSGYFMSKSVLRQHFLTQSVWHSKLIAWIVTNIDPRNQPQKYRSTTLVSLSKNYF